MAVPRFEGATLSSIRNTIGLQSDSKIIPGRWLGC